MSKKHTYQTTIEWTGNKGSGTSHYQAYERSHTISIENKPTLLASSDAAFRGDKTKHNPEDLFLASISSCHMLWYLHLCADAGIHVVDYQDNATGILEENPTGGKFIEVTLHPMVVVKESSMVDEAYKLHHKANEQCFMANSLNFKVKHEPIITTAGVTTSE